MPEYVDLRSDTVTKPGPAMRRAMFEAEVGDDVFLEDPTIGALEEKAAHMLGKTAALFVPSGTMANQLAIKSITDLGDEVLLESGAHPFLYESGAAAVISSVQIRTLPGRRGLLTAGQIEAAIHGDDNVHLAPTRAVCIENSHNRGGGAVYPLETVREIGEVVRKRGLKMHLDGARLFNACVASGESPRDYAAECDTVSFCLSKGLGAPAGSMLVSDEGTITRARRWRKMMGGGMRQAGILAAAGLYALEHHVDRLAEDHENAQVLARGLAEIQGIELDPAEVETNITIFKLTKPGLTPAAFAEQLEPHGVRMIPFGPDLIRAVTHLDVDRAGVHKALKAVEAVMA